MVTISEAEMKKIIDMVEDYKIYDAAKFFLERVDNGDEKIAEETIQKYKSIIGKHEKVVRNFKKTVTCIEQLSDDMDNDEGWELLGDDDGIRCLYQRYNERGDDLEYHCVRLESEVDTPLFNFSSQLYEMDLFTTWIPSFWGVGLTKVDCDHHSVMEMNSILELAFPPIIMSNRIANIDVRIYDTFETMNKVVICIDDEEHGKIPDGYARARMHRSGITIKPTERKTADVKMLFRVNAELSIVPEWLIDVAFSKLARSIMEMIKNSTGVTDNEPYLTRYSDPENKFYNYLRKRIKEVIPEQLPTVPPVRQV